MKGRLRVAMRVIALAVALVAPSIAKAQEGDVEPVRVRFDGHPGCPDATRFFDQVRARTTHVRLAEDGEAARTFRVSVHLDHGRSVGQIVIEETAQASVPRRVEAATCAEAVDAVALIAALSIDPNASMTPTAVAQEEAPLTAPEPESAPPAQASASPNVPTAPPETKRAEPAPERRPIAPSRWTFASGLGVDAVALGQAAASPRIFFDVTRDTPSVLAPSFRLSAARAASDVADSSTSQTARMVWLTGDLAFCPLHVVAQRLATCADVEAGILEGHPGGTGTRARTRPWLAPGLSLRLRAVTIPFAARGDFFLEVEAGARVPLVRDEFYFEPNSTVYKAPAIVLRAGIGAGVRFW